MNIQDFESFFKRVFGLEQYQDANGASYYALAHHGEISSHSSTQVFEAETVQLERQMGACYNEAFRIFKFKLENSLPLAFSAAELNQNLNEAEQNLTLTFLGTLQLNFLAQAIVDGDEKGLKALLDSQPELLLARPWCAVTSHDTDQTFAADNFLGLALRRRQMQIVNVLYPYFERLLENEAVKSDVIETLNDALKQVNIYELDAKGLVIIPDSYSKMILDLVKKIYPDLRPQYIPNHKDLGQVVEDDLKTLLTTLCPSYCFTKDNHFDVELLLLAAFRMQRPLIGDAGPFPPRVIGLIERFLTRETALWLCNHADSAGNPSFLSGKRFFSHQNKVDHETRQGLGYDYYREALTTESTGHSAALLTDCRNHARNIEKHLTAKNTEMQAFKEKCQELINNNSSTNSNTF